MKFSNLLLAAAAALAMTPALAAEPGIAAPHAALGLGCESCHGPDKANPATPTLETCTTCHELKGLVAKTASVKPTNPHMSPHYQDQLDCTLCHMGHAQSENYCAQCHQFDFKVP